MHVLCQAGIENPREDSFFAPFEVLIRGDDRRELLVVSVIEDLIELLSRPRSCVLCPEVVQNEKLGIANSIESIVVRDPVAGIECCAKVIEQVRHDCKEHA